MGKIFIAICDMQSSNTCNLSIETKDDMRLISHRYLLVVPSTIFWGSERHIRSFISPLFLLNGLPSTFGTPSGTLSLCCRSQCWKLSITAETYRERERRCYSILQQLFFVAWDEKNILLVYCIGIRDGEKRLNVPISCVKCTFSCCFCYNLDEKMIANYQH